jgi:pilus assembly protein CpaF
MKAGEMAATVPSGIPEPSPLPGANDDMGASTPMR